MHRSVVAAAALAIGIILVLAGGVQAQQTITAVGRVVDAQGNPIRDVQVLLDYKGHVVQKYHTKTDKNGVFTHVNVYAGPYRITLKKEGLGEVSLNFNLQEIDRLQKPPEFKFGSPAVAQAPPPPPGSGLAPAAGGGPVNQSKLVADINAAMALSQQGRTDDAIAAYENILTQAPMVPIVHYNLGTAYKKKGDAQKAEASMRRSFELDPLYVDGYVGLATILAEGGKKDAAIEVIKQGITANDGSGRLQYALGVLAESSGDSAAARQAFLKAEELDPQNVETQYHLGTVALSLNDKVEAVARLEKFIASAPPETPNLDVAKALVAALQKK